ncbi:hypothetical protein DUNSADRAFT_87 [Dunaliella salina]|uniref:Uncharacterized protein n=1 Tax=Dunaliella salina TaxID=3046 RepID=A0ABQ7H8W0_DUNSA|nr:hypothetical protein DUNSADRAFT_87 [Dunaliella salina]|eukprot:KAF5843285.1 hypothetical protein DUNSADRAFT_87 [Dunaliella salina]
MSQEGLGLPLGQDSQSQAIAELLQPPPVFNSQENDPVPSQTAPGPPPSYPSVQSSAAPPIAHSFPQMPPQTLGGPHVLPQHVLPQPLPFYPPPQAPQQQHQQAPPATSSAQKASNRSSSEEAQPKSKNWLHPSIQKLEHKGSRASRRGPMDEMRQLVRILVKFIPKSAEILNTSLDNGGGNRVSEEQIKNYLRKTLGEEAPQPEWGLPEGWGQYLSELLCWALDRPITREQAMGCARRQQGRSWEIVESAVRDLDIYSYAWPVPLTLAGIRAAQADPGMPSPGSGFLAPTHSRRNRPSAASVAAKRPPSEEPQGPRGRKEPKREERSASRPEPPADEFANYTAQDCLAEALKFVQAGSTKMQHRGPRDSPESFESLWSLLSSILAARPHPMLASMPPVPHIGSMPMGLGMGPLGMPGLEGMAAAAAAGTLPLPGITSSLPPMAGDLNSMMHVGSMGMNMAALGGGMGMGGMGMAAMGGSMPGVPPMHGASLPQGQGPAGDVEPGRASAELSGAQGGLPGGCSSAAGTPQGAHNAVAHGPVNVPVSDPQAGGAGLVGSNHASAPARGLSQPDAGFRPVPHQGFAPAHFSEQPQQQQQQQQSHQQQQQQSHQQQVDGQSNDRTGETPKCVSGEDHAPVPVRHDSTFASRCSAANNSTQGSCSALPNGYMNGLPPLQGANEDALFMHGDQGARKPGRGGSHGRGHSNTENAQDGPYRDQLSVLALAASQQGRKDMLEGGAGGQALANGGLPGQAHPGAGQGLQVNKASENLAAQPQL